MMKPTFTAIISFSLIGCTTSSSVRLDSASSAMTIPEEEYQTMVTTSANNILQTTIAKHISFLASDDLLGRDTPSQGLETAAQYIADQLTESGLQPLEMMGPFSKDFLTLAQPWSSNLWPSTIRQRLDKKF